MHTSSSQPPRPAPPASVARILVIEDDPSSLKLMGLLLRSFGHRVSLARGGEEGLAREAADRPDLVLCDLQMPGVDGFEVLRRLDARAGGRPAPVVAVTALAMLGDREWILAAGFDGYLPKPIDPTTLAEQVDQLLAGGNPAAERQPQSRHAVLALTRAQKGAALQPSATIVAVDEAPWKLQLLRSALEPLGCRVLTASSVEEALRRVRECCPDLVLADLRSATNGADELLRALRSDPELPGTAFAFLSYSATDANVAAAATANVPLLVRSGEPGELARQVSELLREVRR